MRDSLLLAVKRAWLYFGWELELYGPHAVKLFSALLLASLLSLPLLLALSLFFRAALLLLPLPLLTIAFAPTIWRYLVGRGVDRELPALLAYLLVYSKSPVHVADLLLRAEGEGFRWTRFEIARLRLLLDAGKDPISALKRLAETTPAGKFGEVMRDYVNAQTMGASRTQLSMLLFRRAIDAVGEQWRGHVEFGRVVAEGIVAAIVSVVAITPVALLGGSLPMALVTLPLAMAPAGAIAMLLTRPSIGEYRLGYLESLLTFSVPLAAAAINFKVSPAAGLAFLLGATVAVEIMNVGYRRLSERALAELRAAAEEARLGYLPEERLSRAERLAPEVIRSVISAAKVAGTAGLGEALARLYDLVEEARRHARSASMQAAVLGIVAAFSIPVAIYSLSLLKPAAASMPGLGSGSEGLIEELTRLLLSTSPLVALPAAALQRGWFLSPVYPLISQGVAMAVTELL
ncbi:MAG: hypothetical protein N3F67_01385 [Acidilobaceae archaeon]|nr:hypothetical protein [Acidilobaceae archaeon]